MTELPTAIVLSACTAVLVAGCASILGMDEGEPVDSTATGGSGGDGGASSSGSGGAVGGAGGTEQCVPSECPVGVGQCASGACVNNHCEVVIEPTGTACNEDGGSYCDGAGDCVECITNDHCGGDPCQDNGCVAASCDDQLQNNGESDVDCGGDCGGCPNGYGCFTYDDCQSKACLGNLCWPCSFHVQCPSDQWYCDDGVGTCYPKKDYMDPCVEDYECKTGICATWPTIGSVCSVMRP